MLASPCVFAQNDSYASTQEYKAMIEEIKSAAPSPAFIATGQRPVADAALKVRVHEDGGTLRLVTEQTEFTFDKRTGVLMVLNEKTRATWMVSFASATSEKVSAGKIARDGNRWTLSEQGPECAPMTLELLSQQMARLTCGAGSDAASSDLTLHVQGSTPLFGLGERFWQAGLAHTNMDVRPTDKFGDPGHNYAYVAIPFAYGPGGLGLYADTVFDTQFNFDAAGGVVRSEDSEAFCFLLHFFRRQSEGGVERVYRTNRSSADAAAVEFWPLGDGVAW